jgi:hypothetical protein
MTLYLHQQDKTNAAFYQHVPVALSPGPKPPEDKVNHSPQVMEEDRKPTGVTVCREKPVTAELHSPNHSYHLAARAESFIYYCTIRQRNH